MVVVTLLFFAGIRERLDGRTQEVLDLPRDTWSDPQELLSYLSTHHFPQISDIQSSLAVAVNECYYSQGQIVLETRDRIALIPPLTGG